MYGIHADSVDCVRRRHLLGLSAVFHSESPDFPRFPRPQPTQSYRAQTPDLADVHSGLVTVAAGYRIPGPAPGIGLGR